MFLRAKVLKEDGMLHRYFSVVENRRVGVKGRTVQRTVLHLGEIKGSRESAWRKTLEAFDETRQQAATLSLFADDEPVADASLDRVLEKLGAIQMQDVWLPTTDGRCLVMPHYTQPEPEQALLLHELKLQLPPQPAPRIKPRLDSYLQEALHL